MEVFTPPPVGALKGNLPPEFVRILDDIKLHMLSKLDVNSSASNVDAFGKSTLKGIFDDIVDVKNNLLLYAEQVHPICWDMLDDTIPNRVSSKTNKHDICKYLVEMWDIFKYLLTKKDPSTVARGNQIYKYLPMMEKLEGKVKLLIECAEEADQNSKSLKIPDEMMNPDICASSVHLKSPKRMKSGVDMIWDRMFGANSLDLSLHKPRLELNAEEMKARKTAKNTRAKMEATELAGLCSNCVKEILACKRVPFSQASDYQSGGVVDELGDNF